MFPPMSLRGPVKTTLGQGADAGAFGSTQYAFIASYQEVLFVNTGSPAIPARGVPQVAALDIHAGVGSPVSSDLRALAA